VKRIVICYDGTWNAVGNPNEVTNVVRVGQAVSKIDDNGVAQMVYYNAGVGSGGPIDQFLGGVFGVGLRSNVKRGLAFLSLNWEPGDEIFIFGFSRGAYSARALAGVIGAIEGIPKPQCFHLLEKVWDYYRLEPNERTPENRVKHKIDQYVRDHGTKTESGRPTPLVKCLGVWDTVGSYGVPAGLGLGALTRKLTSWTRGFHDNTIGRHIEVGLHAMAIDERRRAFSPTTWVIRKGRSADRKNVQQVWFAGAHSNVGGGYGQTGLADLALIWMIARVSDLTNLKFDQDYIAANFWPCAVCSLYRSNRGWLLSSLRPFRRAVLTGPELIEAWSERKKEKREMERLNEKIHWSVIERLGRKAIVDESISKMYAPDNLPSEWGIRKWREENRPTIEKDQRVAEETPTEAKLIALCRKDKSNERRSSCALFCELSGKNAPKTYSLPLGIGSLQAYISSPHRRVRRLQGLRQIWNMEDAEKR
jgi:hypothetical protein